MLQRMHMLLVSRCLDLWIDRTSFLRPSYLLTNCLAIFSKFRLSVSSLWIWRSIKCYNHSSTIVDRRYVFNLLNEKNDHSLIAFVAGASSIKRTITDINSFSVEDNPCISVIKFWIFILSHNFLFASDIKIFNWAWRSVKSISVPYICRNSS